MNIFEQLYCGEIHPWEETLPKTEEYQQKGGEVSEIAEKIIDYLSKTMTEEEAIELFKSYEIADGYLTNYDNCMAFEYGFILAI